MSSSPVSILREATDGIDEFVLRIDGERLGFLEYTSGDGVMRIEYVEVAAELRGSGFGRQLVEAAVAHARENQMRVVPICSYARMVISRDPALSAALR